MGLIACVLVIKCDSKFEVVHNEPTENVCSVASEAGKYLYACFNVKHAHWSTHIEAYWHGSNHVSTVLTWSDTTGTCITKIIIDNNPAKFKVSLSIIVYLIKLPKIKFFSHLICNMRCWYMLNQNQTDRKTCHRWKLLMLTNRGQQTQQVFDMSGLSTETVYSGGAPGCKSSMTPRGAVDWIGKNPNGKPSPPQDNQRSSRAINIWHKFDERRNCWE